MRHLRLPEQGGTNVLLVGLGTIGSEIGRDLANHEAADVGSRAVPWNDPARRRDAFVEAGALLVESGLPAHVVWAAGGAGFAAVQADAERDLAAFQDVLRLVDHIQEAGLATTFHVVSSAGGLFEGGHQVDPTAVPTPRRPYGYMKLEQERQARRTCRGSRLEIHRPSSVYAAGGAGRRAGLIGVLLSNGVARRTSTIFGALDTERDYVHAADVGRYIGQAIRQQSNAGERISMLVSSEPVSIARIIHEVERAIRTRLLVEFRDAWNAADITFARTVRARGFRPMSLVEGIAVTALHMRSERR